MHVSTLPSNQVFFGIPNLNEWCLAAELRKLVLGLSNASVLFVVGFNSMEVVYAVD